ncbi:cytochrome b561-like protein [Aphelenchoides avenae]|nr:cytochrome b561-like protein [Aphelenchus avenae]
MTAQVIKIRPISTSDVSNGKHAVPPADSIAPQHDYSGFVRLYFVAQVLGFSAFTMVAVWMGVYRGGYGFGKAEPVFHWHPLLMNFGLMFLNGQAMMLYRGFRFVPKTITKPLHWFIQFCGAISTIVGIVAAWKYHDLNAIVHVHSIHSWIGISASFLFVCNYLIGLTVFGLPFAPLSLRQK